MDPINLLTNLAVILLIGVLASALANRLKVPEVLFFILIGVFLGAIEYEGTVLFEFPLLFITSISILALAIIVFESTSKIKLSHLDSLSLRTLRFVFIFLIANLLLFTFAAYFIFKLELVLAVLFASVMAGTSPSVVLPLLDRSKHKIFDMLKIEALLNTPLTVLLPFLVLDLHKSLATTKITHTFIEFLGPFLTKFISGIGAGVFVGIVLFKVIKKAYSKLYSPMAVILAALLAYVLAEKLGGNGVLAVTSLGIFFGNIYIKEKAELMNFESVLAKSLYILVFVLVGSLVKLPMTSFFFINSIALFCIYILIRFAAINISFRNEGLSFGERSFMALVCPKGIAVSVVAVVLTGVALPQMDIVLDLILAFLIYSIILSSVICWLKHHFVKK